MSLLRPHFTSEELRCVCCHQLGYDDEFLDHLEFLRNACGFPFKVASGWRCPRHNNIVARSGLRGPHTIGAIDIQIYGTEARLLVARAIELGWTGIGLNQSGDVKHRFVHLDRLPQTDGRPRPWIWTYAS